MKAARPINRRRQVQSHGLFAGIVLLSSITVHAANPTPLDNSRAVGRVMERARELVPLDASETAGNSGLFVGVGQFDSSYKLPVLRYTPDDAVALAYTFAIDLKLMLPSRTYLAISGTLESPEAERKLKELRKSGINEILATRSQLLEAIIRVSDGITDTNALIVMSFSTHGFQQDGQPYVMPFDGNRRQIRETGISLQTIKDEMRSSKANKKLLVVDACRESPKAETRGSKGMSEQLLEALRTAEGMAVMSSCAVGQLSWEAEELQHGVFTHFLIKALEGAAPADPKNGLIRLNQVAEYATKETRNWVRQNKGENQEPFFEGGVARLMPLAFSRTDREAAAKVTQRIMEARRHLADLYFEPPGNLIPDDVFEGIDDALNYLGGDDLNDLLANIESLNVKKRAEVRLFVGSWEKWWKARRPEQRGAGPGEQQKLAGVEAPTARSANARKVRQSLLADSQLPANFIPGTLL